MFPHRSPNPGIRGAGLSVAAALVCAALAARRPTVTYHLAPLVVAAVWPVTLRVRSAVASLSSLLATVGGLLVAFSGIVALDAADLLRGPALVGGSGTAEAVLAAVAGAAWAGITLRRRRPGLLIRALGGDA